MFWFQKVISHRWVAHLARPSPAATADPKALEVVQNQTWLGVIKSKQSISLSVVDFPTGATLAAHSKKRGENVLDRTLYLASKIEVAEEHYMDWDVETESESEDDHEEQDFDMLDGDESPPVKAEGKKPARRSPQKKKTVTVKVEKLDLFDMKTAAKMWTRLATASGRDS
ncbi:hypothetical protein C8F04DRAFT_1187602 [Mycena alexandri]|uniref:Uncharacterized protein n=1 Tax=Mycena alexandri TaxID=1745969 RepID=A0AAD6SLY7_9AGAR|nr:hypothetical protein C8F04DRAFT_1187602 [Mycena alexandri]